MHIERLKIRAFRNLKGMVKYEKEFSSVVQACIRKNAPEAIIGSII